MAEVYFPFDAGPGSTVTESQWRQIARLFTRSGVSEGLAVDTATGQAVTVGVGSALVDGMYYATDSPVIVSVPSNPSSSLPVAGSVVVRLDPSADKVSLVAKLGTPAASPAPPSLTQSKTGTWEIRLADFRLPPSGQAQNPTGIVDRRSWSAAQGMLVARVPNTAAGAGVSETSPINMAPPVTIPASPFGAAVPYRVRITGSASVFAPPGAGCTVRAFIDGTIVEEGAFGNGGSSTARLTPTVTGTLLVTDPDVPHTAGVSIYGSSTVRVQNDKVMHVVVEVTPAAAL